MMKILRITLKWKVKRKLQQKATKIFLTKKQLVETDDEYDPSYYNGENIKTIVRDRILFLRRATKFRKGTRERQVYAKKFTKRKNGILENKRKSDRKMKKW